MRFARAIVLLTTTLTGSAAYGQVPVFDPSVFARQFEQLTELKRQVETLTSQLKVAQDQLGEAKRLYNSFNKLTKAGDVAGLLNSSALRKVLPSDFGEIEKLIGGAGSGGFASSVESYLSQNRLYAPNAGDSFYARELDRIARQTGTTHSLGQAIYDTASRRIDELDRLRQQIGQAGDVKDVLDLSARIQSESSLLQNDVLRMQGLAMIQRARAEMDVQRDRERGRKLIDEMKEAVQ